MATIEFTPEEIEFAVSIADFTKKKVVEMRDASHSGIDKFLHDSQIIAIDEFVEKMKAGLPEPDFTFVEQMPIEG